MLLSMFIILCIRTLGFTPHFKFILLNNTYPVFSPTHPNLGTNYNTLIFYESGFFRFQIWVVSHSICLSVYDLHHLAWCPQNPPRYHKSKDGLPTQDWMVISHLYPFMHWQAVRLSLRLGYYSNAAINLEYLFNILFSFSLSLTQK